MIMQPDPFSELQDVLSSPSDTTDSGESDPDFVVAPSSSSPASTEGEEDSEDPGSGWTGRNGEVWFSTNVETTPFLQPARGVTPGPTRYAIARVTVISSEGQGNTETRVPSGHVIEARRLCGKGHIYTFANFID
ncbi:hypothetical protein DPX16_10491 [Anabarilius grahami]|uniref:Uncharacterized protein n=1 Tax=Anabarilius grahami TaxID=495550 RepID=A0A3N0Z7Z3_ANAGA|nr:hypothetical protein DPX16_10491 [Anabarilius grahami]